MKLASEVLEPDSIPLILYGRNRLLFSRKDLLLHLVFKLLLEGVKFLKELDFEAFNVDQLGSKAERPWFSKVTEMVVLSFEAVARRGVDRVVALKGPVEDGRLDGVLSEGFEISGI